MKTFRDPNNSLWTVFEVRRQVSKGDGAYLPSGYGDGWLCFENGSAKRRLVRYPARWNEFSDVELAKLLAQAAPAPRSSWHLGDDASDAGVSPAISE